MPCASGKFNINLYPQRCYVKSRSRTTIHNVTSIYNTQYIVESATFEGIGQTDDVNFIQYSYAFFKFEYDQICLCFQWILNLDFGLNGWYFIYQDGDQYTPMQKDNNLANKSVDIKSSVRTKRFWNNLYLVRQKSKSWKAKSLKVFVSKKPKPKQASQLRLRLHIPEGDEHNYI